MDEEQTIVVKQRTPLVDGKTLLIGGGIVGLLLWFFFFRGGGGAKGDKQPLTFKLRNDGLWLGNQKFETYSDAIVRVKAGGKSTITLQVAGDVPQGEVTKAASAFAAAGITVLYREPQSISSVYARGLGSERYS